LRRRTLAALGSFVPTYMYNCESGDAGPSSSVITTVLAPVPAITSEFSFEKRPIFGSACASLSKIATAWPPRLSNVAAPSASSPVR
jgi:hypothetical protein